MSVHILQEKVYMYRKEGGIPPHASRRRFPAVFSINAIVAIRTDAEWCERLHKREGSEEPSVENQVAIVTGAGQGVVRAIALRLAQEGMHNLEDYYERRACFPVLGLRSSVSEIRIGLLNRCT